MALEGSTITFEISNPESYTRTYYWRLTNETWENLQDYDFSQFPYDTTSCVNAARLSISGNQSSTVTLHLNDDNVIEGPETFGIIASPFQNEVQTCTPSIAPILTFTVEDRKAPTLKTSSNDRFPSVAGRLLELKPGSNNGIDRNQLTWNEQGPSQFFYLNNNTIAAYYTDSSEGQTNGYLTPVLFRLGADGTVENTAPFDPIPKPVASSTWIGAAALSTTGSLLTLSRNNTRTTSGYRTHSQISKHNVKGSLRYQKPGPSNSSALASDGNGGILIISSNNNETDVSIRRLKESNGNLHWETSDLPWKGHFDGSLRNSGRPFQPLADGTVLVATSNADSGTEIARLSLRDGSLIELLGVDRDYSYWYHEFISENNKIFFRTAEGNHLIETDSTPILIESNLPSSTTGPGSSSEPNASETTPRRSTISRIKPQDVRSLGEDFFDAITQRSLKTFNKHCFRELSPRQIGWIEPTAFKGSQAQQLRQLSPQAATGLQALQIRSIPRKSFRGLDRDALASLTPEAITGIDRSHARHLKAAVLNSWSETQIQSLTPASLSGLKPKERNAISVETAQLFSSEQLQLNPLLSALLHGTETSG